MNFQILFLTFIIGLFLSCDRDFLSKAPVDIISEDLLFSDLAAYETHIAYLYNQAPFTDEFYSTYNYLPFFTNEMVNNSTGQRDNNPVNPRFLEWWVEGYRYIRNLNILLNGIDASDIFVDQINKDNAKGELLFLRAFAYYNLAIRYGGVPIVTEVLEVSGNIEDLYQERASENEIWEFIRDEMMGAIRLMNPEKATQYRFSYYNANAFMSQAMLFPAAVGKYGQIQLNGLLGISPTESDAYYSLAKDAAKIVIESDQFHLYNRYEEDKVLNYSRLFFDKSENNKERIFTIAHIYPETSNNQERTNAPFGSRCSCGFGGHSNPTLDMIEQYEYQNDRDGSLKISENGVAIAYKNPADLFEGKEARFMATILFPGAMWKGTPIEIYTNIVENGELKGRQGKDGIGQSEATPTGFYVKKWQDPNPPRPIGYQSSEVDNIRMRYAEVLLNYIEASIELNDNDFLATNFFNQIRNRAGLEGLEEINIEEYRKERLIELAYEGQRYWDQIRWRIADKILDNIRTSALYPTWNTDEDTWTFEKVELTARMWSLNFPPSQYYRMIPTSVIKNNPLIIQNPGH